MTAIDHDGERLQEWLDFVPTARAWLSDELELTLSGKPDSLLAVWSTAMDRITPAASVATPAEHVPAWARYEENRNYLRSFSPFTVELLGAVAAYYGALLQEAASPPPPSWMALRHPTINLAEEGDLVLAREWVASEGLPAAWVSPLRDLLVLGSVQLAPVTAGRRVVGKNDPERLRALFDMRLRALG